MSWELWYLLVAVAIMGTCLLFFFRGASKASEQMFEPLKREIDRLEKEISFLERIWRIK